MAFLFPRGRHEVITSVDAACAEIIEQPLRDILHCNIKPKQLPYEVYNSQSTLNLSSEEKSKCCPKSPKRPDYDDFDIKLLYKLIKNLCPSLKPTKGWGEKPEATNTELGDDIERLIQFKDKIMALAETKDLGDGRSEDVWNDLELAIDRIQKFAIKHDYTPSYQYTLKHSIGNISKHDELGVVITCECEGKLT